MPQTAIAGPCRSGGFIDSSTDCDSGTSAAPQIPCPMRQITSCVRLVELPASTENTVNPTTEKRKTYLMPNCPASHPVSGIMIAVETM